MKQDLKILISECDGGFRFSTRFEVRVVNSAGYNILRIEYFSEYSDASSAAKFLSVEHCAAITDETQVVLRREVKACALMNGTPQKSVI